MALIAPGMAAAQGSVDTGADAGIADIIVTAQRREQSLKDVPLSISAVTGASLAKSGVTTARELTLVVPGLNFTQNGVAIQPTIRGIGTVNSTVGDEANVAIYIDGIYQPSMVGNAFDLNSIERVEVLKGPQGTLFGRNATGGAVNVITRKPSYDPSVDAEISYARFNDVMVKAYATGSLSKNIAASIATVYGANDGYIDDLVRGGHIGKHKNISARFKLLIDASDTFHILLGANYANLIDNTALSTQPLNGNFAAKGTGFPIIVPGAPRQSALSFVPQDRNKIYGGDATMTLDLDWAQLKSISSYQVSKFNGAADSDVSTLTLLHIAPWYRPAYSFSQELQLASSKSGWFHYVVGAYYFDNLTRDNPLTAVSGAAGATSFTTTLQFQRLNTKAFAVFGEVTAEFGSGFELTAGARYSNERKIYDGQRITTNTVGVTGAPFVVHGERTFKDVTPRVSLRYSPSTATSIYATYSRGFKSGQFNTGTFSNQTVEPEHVDAYEIGLKTAMSNRVRFETAGYLYKYKDIQTAAFIGNGQVLANAARAKIYGVEATVAWAPVHGLELNAGFNYNHANYEDFRSATIFVPKPTGGNTQTSADVSGNRMIRTPEYTFNVSANYRTPLAGGTLAANATAFFSGNYFWDPSNRIKQPAYEVVNARLSWTDPSETYTLAVFGKNLTNQDYLASVVPSTNADTAVYFPPRSIGASVGVHF